MGKPLHASLTILPIIAAAGHVNYLKSLFLYLHKMFNLSSENTRVHEMFVVDKSLAFLKLMKVTGLCSIPKILCSNSCIHLDIAEAGRKTMFLFYNCKTLKSKDKLHHQILVRKVTTAKFFVTPDFFPLINSSTKYHSYRSYK